MTDGRYSIAPPLDAERIISAQLAEHASRLDGDGRPTRDCAVCGRLPDGLTLTGHRARFIWKRPHGRASGGRYVGQQAGTGAGGTAQPTDVHGLTG